MTAAVASGFDALGDVSSRPGSLRVLGACWGWLGRRLGGKSKCQPLSLSNGQVEETPSPPGVTAAARPRGRGRCRRRGHTARGDCGSVSRPAVSPLPEKQLGSPFLLW